MDMETVITHLQIIHTWAEFARERDLQFFTAKHLEDIAQWSSDALVMIEEQKQMYFTLEHDWRMCRKLLKEQEEVVHCKDCKHFEPDGIYTMCYRHNGLSQNEDWFCADGERKEE